MSTDYDCWRESEESVSVEQVMGNMVSNAEFAKNLLTNLIPLVAKRLSDGHLKSVEKLKGTSSASVMTSLHKRSPELVKKIRFILPEIGIKE
jgi:5'-methylthioadenosine phosphorylase